MRKSWIAGTVIAAGAFVLLAVWFHAAAVAEPTVASVGGVAVVDIKRVFNENEWWKAVNRKILDLNDAAKEELKKRQDAVDALEKELRAFKPDSPEFRTKSEAYLQATSNLEAWKRFEGAQVEMRKSHWVQDNYNEVQKIVTTIAKERHLSLVLVRDEIEPEAQDWNRMFIQIINRKVLYYDEALDVTDIVLKRLNEEFQLRGGADSVK